jgi:signal transduction histidine kinase
MSEADQSDLWVTRTDRLARIGRLPLLAAGAVLATISVAAGFGTWHRFLVGLPVVLVAAGWTLGVTERRPGQRGAWHVVGFVGQTVLAAVLVGVNPWFGVFAWTGYLLVDRLPRRWAVGGILATALVVGAAQIGGYPTATTGSVAGYLLVVSINLVIALVVVGATDRMLEQNRERGRVIAELAETNRLLEAALAENAGLHEQLVVQAREAGVLDERQRLAGEIHDTLAQGLVGIVTQLEAAVQTSPDLSAEGRRHLEQASTLARSSVAEARRSVQALRPEQLEQADLVKAVQSLSGRWAAETRVVVRTETTGTPRRVPAEVEFALYRVVQEALTNVAKHAAASKVGVTLSFLDDVLLLDVRDDGRGFDPAGPVGGFGVKGMGERLARVGGSLQIESTPGEGTAVNARVPVGAVR